MHSQSLLPITGRCSCCSCSKAGEQEEESNEHDASPRFLKHRLCCGWECLGITTMSCKWAAAAAAPPAGLPAGLNRAVSVNVLLLFIDPSEMNTRRGGGSSWSPAAAESTKEARSASALPPFLSKTYDLVDDPSSDSTVSWGADGQRCACAWSRLLAPCHRSVLAVQQRMGPGRPRHMLSCRRRRRRRRRVAPAPCDASAPSRSLSCPPLLPQLHRVEARRVCSRPAAAALQAQQLLQLCAPAQHLCASTPAAAAAASAACRAAPPPSPACRQTAAARHPHWKCHCHPAAAGCCCCRASARSTPTAGSLPTRGLCGGGATCSQTSTAASPPAAPLSDGAAARLPLPAAGPGVGVGPPTSSTRR